MIDLGTWLALAGPALYSLVHNVGLGDSSHDASKCKLLPAIILTL